MFFTNKEDDDGNTEQNKSNEYKWALNQFKFPIDYCKKVHTIDTHIQSDLELVKSDSDNSDSIYNNLVKTETVDGKEILPDFASKFSTNTKYLKDTQRLLKH